MKTRILSGLIMVPLLVVFYLSGYVLLAACFVISILAVREFFKGFENIDIKPSFPIACVAAVLIFSGALFLDIGLEGTSLCIFVTMLLSLLYLVKNMDRKLEDAMATILGVFYVVFFSLHIALVGLVEPFVFVPLVWLIVITAFSTDIMAYFTGYLFGKRKLCPNISPKKTIAGAVGGIIGSILSCGAFGFFVIPELLIHCLIIGLLGSIAAQLGDLTASIFKRKMGIKDYGNLIPGHGGVLDRIDSLLFTGPLVYYYCNLILSDSEALWGAYQGL